jgi:hypothetical protein
MRNRIAELEQQLAEKQAYINFLEMENAVLACDLAQANDHIEGMEESLQ